MVQPRKLVLLAGAAAAAFTALRHGRHGARGHQVPGGILISDATVHDKLSRLLLDSLYGRIAADVAAVAPDGARVLEVGSGRGHLSIRLARHDGFDVTGLDLDPAMVGRARANTDRAVHRGGRRPSFLVGGMQRIELIHADGSPGPSGHGATSAETGSGPLPTAGQSPGLDGEPLGGA